MPLPPEKRVKNLKNILAKKEKRGWQREEAEVYCQSCRGKRKRGQDSQAPWKLYSENNKQAKLILSNWETTARERNDQAKLKEPDNEESL